MPPVKGNISQVEPTGEMELMDLPDDMLREVFKKSSERNMLLMNKTLTKALSKDVDIALLARWLHKKKSKDDHESELQFRDLLRRGLDPNIVMMTYKHPYVSDKIETPLIVVLCVQFPLLAKILLRHPGLNHKTSWSSDHTTHKIKNVTIPIIFMTSPKVDMYHQDIEYILETFPEEILRDTFKRIYLTYLVNEMHLSINVLDNILQRGYYSSADMQKKIQELQSSLPGEPKDSETYKYLEDAQLSLIYYASLNKSKGGAKKRNRTLTPTRGTETLRWLQLEDR